MSIRVHRVEEIKAIESFNLDHDKELAYFLDSYSGLENLNSDGYGIFEIPIVVLRQAIGEIPIDADNDVSVKKYAKLNLSESIVANIKADIAFAEGKGDDYVTYYAY